MTELEADSATYLKEVQSWCALLYIHIIYTCSTSTHKEFSNDEHAMKEYALKKITGSVGRSVGKK